MRPNQSITMAKRTKAKKEEFYTEAQLASDPTIDAKAKVGGEFIYQGDPEGEYRGQTVEVKSDTHLEQDQGTGEAIIVRTYQFATNPQAFRDAPPTTQDIFQSHRKGIAAMLWQDGLSPIEGIDPVLIFSKDKSSYLIMVSARAMMGETFIDTPKTLTEILKPNESGNNSNKVPGVL